VHTLEHLLTVFPDAVVMQTHRNPLEVLKSAMHLTEVLEGTFARADDRSQIRKRETRNLAQHMEGITSFREAHPEQDDRFIDVKYYELVSDPLTIVRQIYQRLDMPLTEMAAEKMRSLASRRSRYKGRRGDRKPADFGVDETVDRHRMEAYCSRFEIPPAERVEVGARHAS
jgi:Sulfotransferase family